ncbi:hypothetical protein [Novosphingobium sp. TH158]|uniref:hypothetical protein n=1 Tax=Novosphingobium sp. TH158 TaxID=2067455 RepID=UPI001181C2AD|nr:hypothetical protein [Novosphingobium sp. TH158]
MIAGQRTAPRDAWYWAAVLLAFLATLPPLLTHYPMMTDYPAHLARWHVMLQHGENPVLDGYYGFRWAWSGNLGADILIFPLAALFGLETGGKIILVMIPLLTGLGLISVERALRGRVGIGTMLAMATIWSPSLLMGFMNFTLSLALVLFAFAFWVRSEGWKWREAAFVPIGLIIWLCHQSGWGVLGVMVFAYECHRLHGTGATRFESIWRAALATVPLWLPILPTVLASQQAPGSFSYGRRPLMAKWIFWKTALRDQQGYLDVATVILFVALPVLALFTRKLDGRLGWAALLMALLSLVVPRHLGGGDYADYRLVAVSLMLGLLAIDIRPKDWALPMAAGPFLIRIAATMMAWKSHSLATTEMIKALDHVPRGAKVAFAFEEVTGLWPTPPNGHLGAYATVRRDALVNCLFAIPGVHMLQVKAPGWNFADPSQRYLLRRWQRVDLRNFAPAAKADFLWYYGARPPIAMPEGAEVIFRTKHSFLARMNRPAPPKPGAE